MSAAVMSQFNSAAHTVEYRIRTIFCNGINRSWRVPSKLTREYNKWSSIQALTLRMRCDMQGHDWEINDADVASPINLQTRNCKNRYKFLIGDHAFNFTSTTPCISRGSIEREPAVSVLHIEFVVRARVHKFMRTNTHGKSFPCISSSSLRYIIVISKNNTHIN